jgi:hypothetical protein
VRADGFVIEVLAMEGQRIRKLRLRRLPVPGEAVVG